MRPMYCFHLWQQMQIKEASEDVDVISKNAWIQDDIIMAGLWYCLLYQTDDELSVFTQNVIKPQLTQRERITFSWSGFPNLNASLNLVHTVVSMGVWHAKVPLSRIQNISQLRGDCPRAAPDLWPPRCRRQRKEMFNEGLSTKRQSGRISESSVCHTQEKEWENIQNRLCNLLDLRALDEGCIL